MNGPDLAILGRLNNRHPLWEAPRVEVRDGDDGGTYLVGYASVFDEWTTLYRDDEVELKEVVRKGAFAAAIAERQDVRSLFNHDRNYVLGRTTSGTLSLRETDKGLHQETRVTDAPTIRDLVITPIRRGDITGMSFGFEPRNDGKGFNRNEGPDGTVVVKRGGERVTIYEAEKRLMVERELLSLNLFDVSPVTYPAYPGTSIGLRSEVVDALKHELRPFVEGLRARSVRPGLSLASARLRLAEAG